MIRLLYDYVEQLERDLEAMKKDRDGLKAALLGQVKQQSDSTRNWAKESAALKIRVGVLERENAALREDSELLSWLLKRGVCWRDCDKELEGEFWTVGHDTEWLYDQVRGRERIRAAVAAPRTKEAQS